MKPLDLMIEIERYMSVRGISHDDSVAYLIEALAEEDVDEIHGK